ncbi:MAG: hypothetical protein K940chlam6_00280 [Chlamydiae bacterium]|nr:hypothetical protein [Chlamydiota bacterium]
MSGSTLVISEPASFKHESKSENVESLFQLSERFSQFKDEVLSSTNLEEQYQQFQTFKANLLVDFQNANTAINWEGLKSNQPLQRVIVDLSNTIAKNLGEINAKLTTAFSPKLEVLIQGILQNKEEEGLFRISGNANAVRDLVKKIKEGQINNIQGENVHTLAGTLKQILRDQTPHLLDAIKEDLLNIENLDVQKIQTALNKLEQKNQAILKTLMNFLTEIAAHSENNKMNPTTLATCIGPNLLTITQNANPLDSVQETLKVNTLTAFMIEHSAEIFN